MRNLRKFSSIVPLIASIIMLASSLPASAAEQPQYPTTFDGMPVAFVQTADNTANLPLGQTILVLIDTTSSSPEEAIARLESAQSSKQALPQGWSINIIGGPGASATSYKQLHDADQQTTKGRPPVILKMAGMTDTNSSKGRMTWNDPSRNTMSIDRTNDPGSETVTEIQAQWSSPVVGNAQTTYSALLVNGFTNLWYVPVNGYFFLQSGQTYESIVPGVLSLGYNSWADSSVGMAAQHFANVPYYNNHVMQCSIAQISSGWYMAARDMTNGSFESHLETVAAGGQLQNNWNTSIFFENNNANANWYSGFTQNISVNNAYDGISVPANIHPWRGDARAAYNGHGGWYTNHSSVTGSLTNLGTAVFHLPLMFLWTP